MITDREPSVTPSVATATHTIQINAATHAKINKWYGRKLSTNRLNIRIVQIYHYRQTLVNYTIGGCNNVWCG